MTLICEGACNEQRHGIEVRLGLWRQKDGRSRPKEDGEHYMPKVPADLAADLRALAHTEHFRVVGSIYYECCKCGGLRRWGRSER